MKVSIVCATYNRGALLDRALYTYTKQTLPKEEWEYVLIDDCSTDNTLEVCEKYKDKINLRVLDAAKDLGLPKEPGQWRDGCKLRNAGSTFAFGEIIISTHPEIMIPPTALEIMYEASHSNPNSWITAIPYWLPSTDYDQVDWRSNLNKLNSLPGFYDPSWPDPLHSPGAPDYRNQNQEIRDTWESEVFWAMTMSKWRWLGGFRNFDQWGSVDMDFHARRRTADIPTVIAKDNGANLMVYHQFHESKRDMDAAMEGVKDTDYSSLERMREQGGLYSVYNHGHRERATDGNLSGIMQDHIQRYEWANSLITPGNKITVLDLCCGTGYGSTLLNNAATYNGVDADAESITWANTHYGAFRNLFEVGKATSIPYSNETYDMVVCFEGLEHVEDQPKMISEIRRVLKPGGYLLLSTPQKGATGGTPWDKYMLTHEELLSLFSDCQITPYYQLRYGTSEVRQGTPPADAEIQILVVQFSIKG